MTYREMFDDVVMSGAYPGSMNKVKRLAQLIYANDRSQNKAGCVWEALERYEDMTGRYMDPTEEQFDEILYSIA